MIREWLTTQNSSVGHRDQDLEAGDVIPSAADTRSQEAAALQQQQDNDPVPLLQHRTDETIIRRWPSVLNRLMGEANDDEWAEVIARIHSHPDEVSVVGRNGGLNGIHAACLRYPPVHVMEALLAARPEAATGVTYAGESPLHLASYSSSEEVQHLLIRAAPSTVLQQDRYGDCPLHFAARLGSTHSLMQAMLEVAPQSMACTNQHGVSPFWLLPRSYREARDLTEIFVNEENESDEESACYLDDWNMLELFLRHDYTHNGFRVSSQNDDSNGNKYRWMLHAAAASMACPNESLRCLCRWFPASDALVRNEAGYTPLILATRTKKLPKPDVEEDDDNNNGDDSGERERERENTNAGNGNAGDGDDNEAAGVSNTKPVDPTEPSTDAMSTALEILLNWNPQATQVSDRIGRLPLAHAIVCATTPNNNAPATSSTTSHVQQPKDRWPVLKVVLGAYPRALQTVDPPTQLRLFQLAAASNHTVDVIFRLLRALPEAIHCSSSSALASNRHAVHQRPSKQQRLATDTTIT